MELSATIRQCEVDGIRAYRIGNAFLEATVVPVLGGKFTSIQSVPAGVELLFQSGHAHRARTSGAAFGDYEMAGWDECFPTVDQEFFEYKGRTLRYPDHGEVWTLAFDHSVQDDRIVLEAAGSCLPYQYRKRIGIEQDSIVVSIEIENRGSFAWPALWVMHGLLRWQDSMKLQFPGNGHYPDSSLVRVYHSQKGGHGREDLSFNDWPGYPPQGEGEKLYVRGKVAEARCAIDYPELAHRVSIGWDNTQLPYLGLWMCNGLIRGDRNIAFEPANAFYDKPGIAAANKALPVWEPGETKHIDYRIRWAGI